MTDLSKRLGQNDTGLILGQTFGESNIGYRKGAVTLHSYRVNSPEILGDSNDELSSHTTETSPPSSLSLWLSEFSEDEEERLENSHLFMRFKAPVVAVVFKAFLSWKNDPSEQDEPSDGADEANHPPNGDKGKGKDAPTRKRKPEDPSESGKGTTEGSEHSSGQTASRKRMRTSDRKLTFACPYTKKDPMSYKDCYRYTLSRVRDVKQHLPRRHQKPLYCPRCMETFEDERERDGHVRALLCPLRPSITLDGINESQRKQLARKSASNTSDDAQWFAIYDILFPGHHPRPESPDVDRELLQDITLYQEFLTSNGPQILSDLLTRRGAIAWNLPNGQRDLVTFQRTVFEEGLREIFDQWVTRRSSRMGQVDIPSISAMASNMTPPSSDTSVQRAVSNSNQAPRVPSTISGQDPANAITGSDIVQGASLSENHVNEGLEGALNFGQENMDFPQEFSYEGSDEDLLSMMLGSQARSPFPPAPG